MMKPKNTITKRHLVEVAASVTGTTQKKTYEVIEVFLDSIAQVLADGGRLELRDFGVFEPVVRKAKQGRDLQNNQSVEIPSHTTVKFTPGKKLRSQLRL